jgi:hypothetical protein
MLLQLLAANTMLLHQQHAENLQQQQQLHPQVNSSSSSGSSQNQQQREQQQQQQRQQPGQSCKQHRADLLLIPAFHQHQDMLQLLPGGQTYLDAAAARAVLEAARGLPNVCCLFTAKQAGALKAVCMSLTASEQSTTDVPVLSAAALRLVLELQLLAAGAVQRQQGSSRQQPAGPYDMLLRHSNALLHAQIRAIVQDGSNSVLAQLLQQHGLQLLQALAAPLQQLQLWMSLGDDAGVYWGFAMEGVGALPQQLFALTAAAEGLHVPTGDDNTSEYLVWSFWGVCHLGV